MQSSQNRTNNYFTLAAIATQRFGLGPRPNEIAAINHHAEGWLLRQLSMSPALSFDTSLPDSAHILAAQTQYKQANKAYKKQQQANAVESNTMAATETQNKTPKDPSYAFYKQLTADALQQAIVSENSFNWRCLDFFSNHFSVTAQGSVMTGLCATLEREAIAPNLFGRFEDLLLAVCKHPAMLIYLNNENSIGPSTRYAKKNRGLNENLAREILELHTLGVNGGYQQQDVTELAKGITGWSVAKPGKDKQQGFIYRAKKHEPGTRLLLGKSYAEQGLQQGELMLKALANHASTARLISTKIVQSFISDQAPTQLVDHLTAAWHASKGDLKVVFKALISHPRAWQVQQQKYKTPREYVVSTYRTLASKRLSIKQAQSALKTLGQQPFKAGSPAGYSDQQRDWDGASALMARINWVSQLAGKKRLEKINIDTLIETSFANTLSTNSYQMITRAESRQQALILLLLSPEFLTR